MQQGKQTRCVITGLVDGRSVITADKIVEATTVALAPGAAFNRVYGTAALQLPNDGSKSAIDSYFPPAGGMAVYTLTLPPDAQSGPDAQEDMDEMLEEASRKLPGLLEVMENDGSTMHTTPTIDVLIVLSGRVLLELDDGVMTEVGPGDVVVQNGTRHAWRNPFDAPAVMHGLAIGVQPSER